MNHQASSCRHEVNLDIKQASCHTWGRLLLVPGSLTQRHLFMLPSLFLNIPIFSLFSVAESFGKLKAWAEEDSKLSGSVTDFIHSLIHSRKYCRDFLGSSVVKTLPSNGVFAGWIPGWRARIPHDSWPKTPKIQNRNNIVTNSVNT